MPDRHGWRTDGELPNVELSARAVPKFRSLVHKLRIKLFFKSDIWKILSCGCYLIECGVYVVCKLNFCYRGVAHRGKADSKARDALLSQGCIKHTLAAKLFSETLISPLRYKGKSLPHVVYIKLTIVHLNTPPKATSSPNTTAVSSFIMAILHKIIIERNPITNRGSSSPHRVTDGLICIHLPCLSASNDIPHGSRLILVGPYYSRCAES